ncbi:MAG: AAA family ATPase, partial [Raoultibacter sp.]
MMKHSDDTRRDSVYLERLKIDAFGPFSNRGVGPFSPHLNVVYGKNEAGKTTLNKFIEGVLFGWEEARGARNTYKPLSSERSGSLYFADEKTGAEFEVSRVKNAQGLVGEAAAVDLFSDIDKETFSTMFALTSDELRSLRNTTDVTARLLTAGSGTSASPAHALAAVQERLIHCTSRASSAEQSITNLLAEKEELHAAVAKAAAETDRLKAQDKEFHELEPQRADLLMRERGLTADIEKLVASRSALEKIEVQRTDVATQRAALHQEEADLVAQYEAHLASIPSDIASIDESRSRRLRDTFDDLANGQSRCEHGVTLAREDYRVSYAKYETLLVDTDMQELEAKARSQRHVQVALSIILPLVFVGIGVPLTLHGRIINSLSFTALGLGLVLFAVLLAAAALVMLFRPSKIDEALAQRKQDAQWVMLQDKKKLETCEQEMRDQAEKIDRFLTSEGLSSAQGSLRRARSMLDEAKEFTAETNLFKQKQLSFTSQKSALADRADALEEQFSALVAELNLASIVSGVVSTAPVTPEIISALIEQKSQQRVGLQETIGVANRRFGELKNTLEAAEHQKRFDALKLQFAVVKTRLSESYAEYATLLLARRSLEAAIAAWESKSQPEVYRQASRLFADMTDGRWTKVCMSSEGKLQVVDALKATYDPLYLSLGTCQQLYLALRIALLMAADNVGCATPILADDILVNFDNSRRVGAARALFELSNERQVILFTCHEEIVNLMQDVDSQINRVQ